MLERSTDSTTGSTGGSSGGSSKAGKLSIDSSVISTSDGDGTELLREVSSYFVDTPRRVTEDKDVGSISTTTIGVNESSSQSTTASTNRKSSSSGGYNMWSMVHTYQQQQSSTHLSVLPPLPSHTANKPWKASAARIDSISNIKSDSNRTSLKRSIADMNYSNSDTPIK